MKHLKHLKQSLWNSLADKRKLHIELLSQLKSYNQIFSSHTRHVPLYAIVTPLYATIVRAVKTGKQWENIKTTTETKYNDWQKSFYEYFNSYRLVEIDGEGRRAWEIYQTVGMCYGLSNHPSKSRNKVLKSECFEIIYNTLNKYFKIYLKT